MLMVLEYLDLQEVLMPNDRQVIRLGPARYDSPKAIKKLIDDKLDNTQINVPYTPPSEFSVADPYYTPNYVATPQNNSNDSSSSSAADQSTTNYDPSNPQPSLPQYTPDIVLPYGWYQDVNPAAYPNNEIYIPGLTAFTKVKDFSYNRYYLRADFYIFVTNFTAGTVSYASPEAPKTIGQNIGRPNARAYLQGGGATIDGSGYLHHTVDFVVNGDESADFDINALAFSYGVYQNMTSYSSTCMNQTYDSSIKREVLFWNGVTYGSNTPIPY